jgi:P2-related tail formation protein
MTREELKQVARGAIVKHAPELGIAIAERLIESPGMQRMFDRWERKRPHGLVAFVRRLRGKQRGIDEQERAQLEQLVREAVQKYR